MWLVEALDGSKAATQASSDRIRPAAAELAQVTTKSQAAADAVAARAQPGPFTPAQGAAQGIIYKKSETMTDNVNEPTFGLKVSLTVKASTRNKPTKFRLKIANPK